LKLLHLILLPIHTRRGGREDFEVWIEEAPLPLVPLMHHEKS